MCVRPLHCLSLCFKKSVNNDGFELASSASALTSRLATHNGRSSVDRSAGGVWKNDLTAVGNFLWIDSAMSGA
jgi:hypothetical protein